MSNSRSYPLPQNATNPQSIASSIDGKYLATANSNSSSVKFFNATSLSQALSQSLPANSSYCVGIAFASNSAYVLTANYDSNDVSVVPLLLGAVSEGDAGDG